MFLMKTSPFRWPLTIVLSMLVLVWLFIEKEMISGLFLTAPPVGFGADVRFLILILLISCLWLFFSIYMGVFYSHQTRFKHTHTVKLSELTSELQNQLIFGICFGFLAAVFCSLIFVLYEGELPTRFMLHQQILANLHPSLILLGAFTGGLILLWGILLPVLQLFTRLNHTSIASFSNYQVVAAVILAGLIMSGLFLSIAAILAGEWSSGLTVFITIITSIISIILGCLYWLIGFESSLIANVTFCFVVSYLANIFS